MSQIPLSRKPRRPRPAEPAAADDGPLLDLDRYVPAFITFIANKLSNSATVFYQRNFGVNVTEWRILSLLADEEICVCHIHASLDVPQPTASRHLAYLRKSGLVEARRDGIWMHYKMAAPDNPVVAAVVTAALHALTHTDISAKDERRLQVALKAS